MRRIICEKKNHAPLASPAAPKAIYENPPQPMQNNQSEPGGVSDRVSIPAPAHAVGSSFPRACANWEQTQWQANKQPPNNQAMRQLPIPPLPITAYMLKTSKQNKTKKLKRKN